MSELSRAALAIAQGELAKHVQGGLYPYGRFRSPEIDEYMCAVGLVPPRDKGDEGWPWCAAAIHWCFEQAVPVPPDGEPYVNPCPRTAGALHLWDTSPLASRTQLPAPGDVFVLDRGKGRGHCGFVVSASPDGRIISTCEPDTSRSGSATGDAWGEHPFWAPADGVRGVLKGYLNLG